MKFQNLITFLQDVEQSIRLALLQLLQLQYLTLLRVLQLLRVVLDGLAPAVRPGHWPPGTVAPGDDAALVPAPRGGTLVSTDAMGEGTDFLHRWPAGVRTRGHDAGWKAVAQNLSDVNAMGGTASALVTALTLPPTTPLAWVRSFAAGVVAAT